MIVLAQLTPQQRLEFTEAHTTAEWRQSLDLTDRRRLAERIAGQRVSNEAFMLCPDPLRVAELVIERGERDNIGDAPPKCNDRDLRSEWRFHESKRGG